VDNGLSDTSDLVVQDFMTSFEESNQMLGKGLKVIEHRAQAFKNEFGALLSTLSAEFASLTIMWGTILSIVSKLTETDSQMISLFKLGSAIEFSEEYTKVYVAPVFSDVKTLEGSIIAQMNTVLSLRREVATMNYWSVSVSLRQLYFRHRS
jgi:hypothetical protein